MASLANLRFQLPDGSSSAQPEAEIGFSLLFTDEEVRQNSLWDLEVWLKPESAASNDTTPRPHLHTFSAGGLRLEVALQSFQPVLAPVAAGYESIQPEGYAQKNENGAAKGQQLNWQPWRYNGDHTSYLKHPAKPPAPANGPESHAALFHFRKSVSPGGHRSLRFMRRVELPPGLLAHPSSAALLLELDEDLHLHTGAVRLATELGLSHAPAHLGDLLPPAQLQKLQTTLRQLWRQPQGHTQRLSLRAQRGTVTYTARFTHTDDALQPRIRLELKPLVQEETVSAELLRTLFENTTHEAVAWLDADGTVRWANRLMQELAQLPARELEGHTVLLRRLQSMITGPSRSLNLEALLSQGQALRQQVSLKDSDGHPQESTFSLAPFPPAATSEAGAPMLLRLTWEEGGRYKKLLGYAEQRLTSMVDAAPVGICVTDENTLLESVNEAYCQIYGYKPDDLIGQPFTKVVPPSQRAAWEKAHQRFLEGKQDTRGEFTVIDSQGRSRIVLADSTRTTGPDGKPRKITFVLDITERKASEEKLRGSEERLMRVFETAPLGICITSPAGHFETVNQAYCALYGYTPQELIGQPFTKVVPPSQAELWMQTHEKFLAGRTETRGEFTVRHKDGRDLIVLADSTRITGADGQPRKVTFVLDITERKATEKSLKASEERMAALINTAPLGICITDPTGNFESVNDTYVRLYGYTREELIGKPFTMVVPKSQVALWNKTHERFLAGETETRGEFTVMHKSGRQLTILADSLRITGSDGQPRKVTFVLDITERKAAEEQLKRSEERLANLINTAPLGICLTNEDRLFESINATYCQIYGYTPEELIGKPFTMVVPKDQHALWEKTHDRFMAGETETRGEFTVIDKKGRKLSVLADSLRIVGSDGKPKKVTFVIDNTERKKNEQQLKASEERLQALVNTAPIGICITSPTGEFESVNDTYCHTYGYTREELIGKPFTLVVPKSQVELWNKTHERFLAGETETRGEFTVVQKKGKHLTILADSLRITGADGQPRKVTFVLDITERKEAEQQIRQSEERLSALINTAPIGICVTNAAGQFESVNDTYCATYGYTRSELIGKGFTLVVPKNHIEMWNKTHDRFLAGETETRGEFTVVHKDGRQLTILADSLRITGSDGQPKKVTFVLDITDRKHYEQTILQANQQLEESKLALQANNAELEANRAQLQASLNQLELSKHAVDEKNTELEANRRKLEESLGLLEQNQQAMEANNAELNANRQQLQASLNQLELSKKAVDEKNSELEANRQKLELSLADLEASKKALELNNAELEANRQQLQASFTELERSKQALEANNAELQANRTQLEASFAQLEASKKALEVNNAELEASRRKLEASYAEMEAGKQLVQAKNDELEASRKQLVTSMAQLELNKKALEANNAELEANRTQLEQSLAQLEASKLQLEQSHTEVEKQRKELSKANTALEAQQETLKASNAKLEATLSELNQMQGQLLISEKMAALGQLIAGVAHEVNTPISAVKASVRNMMRDMPEAMDELPELMAKMPKTQVQLLKEFLHQVIANDLTLTTKEERQLREQIEETLQNSGVDNAEEVASTLVEIRAVNEVEKFLPLWTSKLVPSILSLAYKMGQLKVNMGNIDLASDKTSRIVKALKNYSYVQSTDKLVTSDLSVSVDTILTLMHNQTKYGIEIVRNYDDVPLVPIYPDELGQVWTNIITNGIQAMGGQGTLTIDIAPAGDSHVAVSIADSGPGIPEEIKHRIFEPFFTTKPQGEGTGLGLDISRKIIEKHQGEISVFSEPGCTRFTVKLPVHPVAAEAVLEAIPTVG